MISPRLEWSMTISNTLVSQQICPTETQYLQNLHCMLLSIMFHLQSFHVCAMMKWVLWILNWRLTVVKFLMEHSLEIIQRMLFSVCLRKTGVSCHGKSTAPLTALTSSSCPVSPPDCLMPSSSVLVRNQDLLTQLLARTLSGQGERRCDWLLTVSSHLQRHPTYIRVNQNHWHCPKHCITITYLLCLQQLTWWCLSVGASPWYWPLVPTAVSVGAPAFVSQYLAALHARDTEQGTGLCNVDWRQTGHAPYGCLHPEPVPSWLFLV